MRRVAIIVLFIIGGCALFRHPVKQELQATENAITQETSIENEPVADTCRQRLYAYIKANWSYDSITKMYAWARWQGASLLPEKFPTCFVGMDSSEVEKLFGKPHTRWEGNYNYFIRGHCHDFFTTTNTYCYFTNIVIDKKTGKVKTANDGRVTAEE